MPNVCGPISEIHRAGMDFAEKTELGTHITNVAVLAEFMTGFAPPRNLYSQVAYRIWGNIPFSSGDFWMSNILDLLYPGYTGSSYYHNETGFSTPTPYGDTADVSTPVIKSCFPGSHHSHLVLWAEQVLLSDCSLDILSRYPVLLLATPIISSRDEVADKLEAYVKAGGHLVVNADSLASLPIFGMTLDTSSPGCFNVDAGSDITVDLGGKTTNISESQALRACPVLGADSYQPVATTGHHHLAYSTGTAFKGTALVLATSGMSAEAVAAQLHNPTQPDTALDNPYPMADHAHTLLDVLLSSQMPFHVGDGLTMVVNRVSSTKYLVAVSNPALSQLPFKIACHVGTVAAIDEIDLQDKALGPTIMAKNMTGYTPPGEHSLGVSTQTTIAGLDQRIFSVTLSKETASLLPTVPPAASPEKIALPLPHTSDFTEDIMLRSTFKQHFDAVILDWTYVERRTTQELQKQGRWAFMRNISLLVDFTSGLNLYPDLRLCNNSIEYAQSIERISGVLHKMSTPVNASTATIAQMFSADAVIAMHRAPENGRAFCEWPTAACMTLVPFYVANHPYTIFLASSKLVCLTFADHLNTTEPTAACAMDTVLAFKHLAIKFPWITMHLHVGLPGRHPSSILEAGATLDLLGHPPNIMLAPSLAAIGNPDKTIMQRHPIGTLFVAGAEVDKWNARVQLHNMPLARLNATERDAIGQTILRSYAANSAKHLSKPWVVIGASMPAFALECTENAEYAEVSVIESMLKMDRKA